MGLKDLCEQLGVEYSVVVNGEGEIRDIYIHSSDTEEIWSYKKPIDITTLAGLFREVYGEALDKMNVSGNPFFLDNSKK